MLPIIPIVTGIATGVITFRAFMLEKRKNRKMEEELNNLKLDMIERQAIDALNQVYVKQQLLHQLLDKVGTKEE